jgi:hypothetical protein
MTVNQCTQAVRDPTRFSPAQLPIEQLADARRRGESFERAWDGALAVSPPQDRAEWREVLGGVVESWRAGWDRRPPSRRCERALLAIAEDIPLPDRTRERAAA